MSRKNGSARTIPKRSRVAKTEAEEVTIESARAALGEDAMKRRELCTKEIQAALEKYGCGLRVLQSVPVGSGQVTTNLEVVPV